MLTKSNIVKYNQGHLDQWYNHTINYKLIYFELTDIIPDDDDDDDSKNDKKDLDQLGIMIVVLTISIGGVLTAGIFVKYHKARMDPFKKTEKTQKRIEQIQNKPSKQTGSKKNSIDLKHNPKFEKSMDDKKVNLNKSKKK